MSDVKRLLSEATSLPWQYLSDEGGIDREGDELQDGHGEMIANNFRDSIVLNGKPIARDAALIVYAVNHLPDYEAAVDALERLLDGLGQNVAWVDTGATLDALNLQIDAARAALARLRDAP